MRDKNPHSRPSAQTVCTKEGLLYFVWEREAIRLRKLENLPNPWTQDPILHKYKFTNIHRKDDRVTDWIVNNIICPNEGREDIWFILLITRLINWPPTLRRLIDDNILFAPAQSFECASFSESIETLRAEGGKVYSGAYMVYPTKMDIGGVKSLALARHIIEPTLKVYGEITHAIFDSSREASIERFVDVLSQCFGISTFMAGQVAADMTYVNAPLADACDIYSYAPIGPGSSRGLNYLYDRVPNAGWTQGDFNKALVQIFNSIYENLGIPTLTLHDCQNIMCEYSKYCRTVLGEGKPKTKYQPEKEF